MRWLLLIIVFEVTSQGIRQEMTATKTFTSRAACDREGESLRTTGPMRDLPEHLKSISICIPESAFNE